MRIRNFIRSVCPHCWMDTGCNAWGISVRQKCAVCGEERHIESDEQARPTFWWVHGSGKRTPDERVFAHRKVTP